MPFQCNPIKGERVCLCVSGRRLPCVCVVNNHNRNSVSASPPPFSSSDPLRYSLRSRANDEWGRRRAATSSNRLYAEGFWWVLGRKTATAGSEMERRWRVFTRRDRSVTTSTHACSTDPMSMRATHALNYIRGGTVQNCGRRIAMRSSVGMAAGFCVYIYMLG